MEYNKRLRNRNSAMVHKIQTERFANHKNQSWSFTQISTIVQYDSEIKTAIQNAYASWKNAIKSILEEIYNDKGDHLLYKAEVILLIVFYINYCG